jgi:MarR family transcriptional regulator, organic hydroperoxide resistance regulator
LIARDSDMPIAASGDKWLQNFVPYLLYRITNHLNRRLRSRLRKEGINISRWRVLAVLRAYGDLNLGAIVELTVMEQPSVSRIVAQLEQEGLVKRKVSRDDSRFVNVSLTAAGEKAFHSIYPAAERHQEKALRGFSRQEINTLTRFLRRIQANIEAEE